MRGYPLYVTGLAVCGLAHPSLAFTTSRLATTCRKVRVLPPAPDISSLTQLNVQGINSRHGGENLGDDFNSEVAARRAFVKKFSSAVVIGSFSSVAAVTCSPDEAQAASSSYVLGTIWNTGKQPKVPGEKPKDKNDTSGTRKDGNFLRSIADCKSQCENSTGPDAYSRSKEECLSDCQDICCKTYEQCSFAIVPRI